MEEFVTYEIAIQLKEKEFSNNCIAYYNEEGVLNPIDTDFINFRDIGENNTKAPLWEQAIDWLEKQHNLDIETYMNYHVDDDNKVSKIYGCLVLQLEYGICRYHQIIYKNKT